MRLLVQRVKQASVSVRNELVGSIGPGLLVFLGVLDSDSEIELNYLARKLVKLRIFSDLQDKMNLSVQDIQGGILLISQFTLFADCLSGNRPSFFRAGKPEKAQKLYELFLEVLKKEGVKTASGVFGASMQVELINDGPVTLIIDSK
ncbi:MAG: D-aminoacyl-tRNA deacylase [Parachlamydiales bacterium]